MFEKEKGKGKEVTPSGVVDERRTLVNTTMLYRYGLGMCSRGRKILQCNATLPVSHYRHYLRPAWMWSRS